MSKQEKDGEFWRLNFDRNVNHLVNKEHDQYLGHQIKSMHAHFKYSPKDTETDPQLLKEYDKDILSSQFYMAVQKVVEQANSSGRTFTVADCFNASVMFMEQLETLAPNRIKHCSVKYTGSDVKDACNINFELTRRSHYMNDLQNLWY